ncbi:uncharacterized protein [Physcomitrium patens]|uniref:uncharacterized protein isoform X2 n=1 Tax=Physcomitrium patens TaxID=3218 RepID=UPI000D16C33E|nr:ras-related protein Rab-23-like [Physcomitrium patens]|eukprot:XP_024372570.1 ras-related protein Rab-23-like [Physcomitrella patens]
MLTLQEEDFESEVKVVVVGNGCVGKTSMIKQFCKGQYSDEYKKTIGVDFLEKHQFVQALEEEVKLMLWDTAGQEQFHSITRSYYRGAKAAVLAFSTTDRESFNAIPLWKHKVEEECGPIPMVLVQNKVDLLEEAVISRQEAEELANELGLRFYRICVKQNLYVSDVFEYLAEIYLQKDPSQCSQTPRISIIGKPPSVPTLNFPPRIGPEVVDPLYVTSTKVTDIRRHRRGRSRILSDCTIL